MGSEMCIRDRLTTKAKAGLTKIGSATAFGWLTSSAKSQFNSAVKQCSQTVVELDPSVPEELAKLKQIAVEIKAMRSGVVEVENSLHSHADKLLTFFAVQEQTTMSSFAVFWFQELPAVRKSLSILNSKIAKKLNATDPIKSIAESNSEDTKRPPSVAWAWNAASMFQKYIDKGDKSHGEKAKRTRDIAEVVLDSLPAVSERTDLDTKIYGTYQALKNTLSIYLPMTE